MGATCPKLEWLLPIALAYGWLGSSAPAVADWDYKAGVLTEWHRVSEYDSGDRLVEEEGALAGVTGSLMHTAAAWRFGIDGEFLDGSLDYDGATQGGAPLSTDTDWTRRSGNFFVDRSVSTAIRIGGTLGYEWRDRDIQSTATAPGLEETYRTVWLGARGEVRPAKTAIVEFLFACALDSTVDVRFKTAFDRASLDTSKHCRARVAASMDVGRLGSTSIFLRPFASWERYPRTGSAPLTSAGVEVGRVFLPKTEFLGFGVTLGIHGHRD